mgnify:CR=1 FL=1
MLAADRKYECSLLLVSLAARLILEKIGRFEMKLSKLDPMTGLMTVEAFGVPVTSLTQNSGAFLDQGTVNAKIQEQTAPSALTVAKRRVRSRHNKQQVQHLVFDVLAHATKSQETHDQ